MSKTMWILIVGIALGVIVIINIVVARHDKALEDSAKRYEACVKVKYEQSPAKYYYLHGEYPVCE